MATQERAPADEPDGGAVAAEAQTQQYGYVRCYRVVVRDCGVSAAYLYGLLEDYAQLSVRNRRECMPSHDRLAELMGVHRNTVVSLLAKLRDTGWVTWTSGQQRNVYTLPARVLHKNRAVETDSTAQKVCSTCTKTGQCGCTNVVHEQEQANKTKKQDTPLPPKGGAKPRRRIPENWTMSAELRAYAVDHGVPDDEAEAFAEEFHRYWRSDGRPKADWDQTFRNRVLEVAGRYGRRAGRTPDINASIVQPRALPEPLSAEDLAAREARRAALEAEREAEIAVNRAAAIEAAARDPTRPPTIRPESWADLPQDSRRRYAMQS